MAYSAYTRTTPSLFPILSPWFSLSVHNCRFLRTPDSALLNAVLRQSSARSTFYSNRQRNALDSSWFLTIRLTMLLGSSQFSSRLLNPHWTSETFVNLLKVKFTKFNFHLSVVWRRPSGSLCYRICLRQPVVQPGLQRICNKILRKALSLKLFVLIEHPQIGSGRVLSNEIERMGCRRDFERFSKIFRTIVQF